MGNSPMMVLSQTGFLPFWNASKYGQPIEYRKCELLRGFSELVVLGIAIAFSHQLAALKQ
jgi:hypothetical protein